MNGPSRAPSSTGSTAFAQASTTGAASGLARWMPPWPPEPTPPPAFSAPRSERSGGDGGSRLLLQQEDQVEGITRPAEKLVPPAPQGGLLHVVRPGQLPGGDGQIPGDAIGPQGVLRRALRPLLRRRQPGQQAEGGQGLPSLRASFWARGAREAGPPSLPSTILRLPAWAAAGLSPSARAMEKRPFSPSFKETGMRTMRQGSDPAPFSRGPDVRFARARSPPRPRAADRSRLAEAFSPVQAAER